MNVSDCKINDKAAKKSRGKSWYNHLSGSPFSKSNIDLFSHHINRRISLWLTSSIQSSWLMSSLREEIYRNFQSKDEAMNATTLSLSIQRTNWIGIGVSDRTIFYPLELGGENSLGWGFDGDFTCATILLIIKCFLFREENANCSDLWGFSLTYFLTLFFRVIELDIDFVLFFFLAGLFNYN
jgi:hypothetical protein